MMNDYDAKDDDDDDGDDASLHLPPLKLLLLLIETSPPPHPLPLLNLLSLKRLLLLSQMLFPSPPSQAAMFAFLSFPTFLGLLSPFSLASSSFFSPPHHLSFLLSCILVKIVKTLNVVVAFPFPHTVSRSQMIFFEWHLFAILKAINVLLTRFSAIDWFKRKQPADCKKFPNRQFVHCNHSQVNKYAMLFNVDHFIIVMTQVPLSSVSSEIIQKSGSPLHPRDWTSRETRKVGNFYLAAAVPASFWLFANTQKQQINQPGENLLHRIMDLQSVE